MELLPDSAACPNARAVRTVDQCVTRQRATGQRVPSSRILMDFFLRSHSFFDSAMSLSISREICSAARRSCSLCFRSSSLSSGGGWSALDSGSWVSAFEEKLVRGLLDLDRILVRLGTMGCERERWRVLVWVGVVKGVKQKPGWPSDSSSIALDRSRLGHLLIGAAVPIPYIAYRTQTLHRVFR
jgi:hypothetical protein